LLEQTGWIECFPVLQAMAQTPQDPQWHPEGDVFVHTAHACDAAVAIAQREGFDASQRTILLIATLRHDFGKVETTVPNERGRWIAPRHAERGCDLAAAFLRRMRAPETLVDMVLPLIAQHMIMLGMPKNSAPPARVVRQLARELAPATIRLWAAVCEADSSGRPPKPPHNPVAAWLPVAEALAVQAAQPKPLLLGRHLLSLGYRPGPGLGTVLRVAFEAQLDGSFQDLDTAIQWVRERYSEGNVSSSPVE
jgi:tRNA nucleotidyltransferase (CCA-adding enzyme)